MFNLPLTRLLVGLPVLFAANTQASASVEVESELRSIHDSQISAHAIGEGSVLDSLSTADFQFTNQAGEWLDRAQYLDIGRGRQIDAVVSDHDVRIRRFGSVAVVNGVFEAKAGSDSLRRVRYTTVYHWNGDAWRLVNAQDTALREGVSRQQRTGSVPAACRRARRGRVRIRPATTWKYCANSTKIMYALSERRMLPGTTLI